MKRSQVMCLTPMQVITRYLCHASNRRKVETFPPWKFLSVSSWHA